MSSEYPRPIDVVKGVRFGPALSMIGIGPEPIDLQQPPAAASTSLLDIFVYINGRPADEGSAKATARLIQKGSVLTAGGNASNTKDSDTCDATGYIGLLLYNVAAFEPGAGDGRYSVVVTHLGTPLIDAIITMPAGLPRVRLDLNDRLRRYSGDDGQTIDARSIER